MAQERNEMSSADTAEIKHEIERTRVEMSETLGEIQERLRPDHLIQQAKDTVTGAATGKVRNIMNSAGERATLVAGHTRSAGRNAADYVRMHPVQVALIAGGITWWLLRNRRSDEWEGASEGWQDHPGYDTYGETEDYGMESGRPLKERVGEYASSAREYASTARETVGEYASTAAERAREARLRMRHAASDARLRARQTWQRTSTSVDSWVHENPLAAGAVAVAVGAAIGLTAPATEVEDRYLGERRDQAMERARLAARDLRDNVTEQVQHVAETVKDTANAISSATTTPTSGTAVPPSTTRSV